jgi:uncharacterized protein YecE (DUF72 family)
VPALIRYGTCAWADHEDFYSPGLPPGERLAYYAQYFSLVEVDSTFYALQPQRNFASWANKTPADFRFNVKAYGAMTKHHREPKPGEEDLSEVFKRFAFSIEPLRDSGKLMALHFQFPPWFTCRPENFEYLRFCREFFAPDIVAFEFRHSSWFLPQHKEKTLSFLRFLDAVHVVCDEPQIGSGTVPAVVAVTSSKLSIVRFHGRNAATWYKKVDKTADRFDYLYSRAELQGWVEPVQRQLAPAAEEVHLLMNNNRANYAVRNALDLAELLGLPVPERDEQGVPHRHPPDRKQNPVQTRLF